MYKKEKKLILGTVQLGMDYGVNNSSGKPSEKEAFDILETAFNNGIEYLDTAISYGDSQKVIGKYQQLYQHRFKICTKLPVIVEKYNKSDFIRIIKETMSVLNTDCIELLYLHRFEQCKNKEVIESLIKSREIGDIRYIGISIYEPTELDYIISNLSKVVDIVQIPFNILDNFRWKRLLQEAHKQGIFVFSRSVYLQGLLLKEADDKFVRQLGAEKYISFINKLADKKQVSVTKVLLDYNRSNEIDGILIGCEKREQLLKNLDYFTQDNCLRTEDLEQISEMMKKIDNKIIDPRKW